MPEVSIITVCYNARDTIRETIESVLAQTYTDYEYLIVDGKSKDDTVAIARSYEAAFGEKGVAYRIFSEPDKGIYDAMNKGIDLCAGRWVLMLNADDLLCDGDVLKDVFGENRWAETDVLYGDSIRTNGVERRLDVADNPVDDLRKSKFFCHQAVFVRTELARELKYDCRFRICGDYDFFLRAYLRGKQFSHVPRAICVYSVLGTSNREYYRTILDNYKVRAKNGLGKDGPGIYIKARIWSLKHRLFHEW